MYTSFQDRFAFLKWGSCLLTDFGTQQTHKKLKSQFKNKPINFQRAYFTDLDCVSRVRLVLFFPHELQALFS